jgi:hypothetical protein
VPHEKQTVSLKPNEEPVDELKRFSTLELRNSGVSFAPKATVQEMSKFDPPSVITKREPVSGSKDAARSLQAKQRKSLLEVGMLPHSRVFDLIRNIVQDLKAKSEEKKKLQEALEKAQRDAEDLQKHGVWLGVSFTRS